MNEREKLLEIARGNVERNLGSCVGEGASADSVYEEAFTLAFDALVDNGVSAETAGELANEVARNYAQP